jgi:general nucleoside transport system permease protein
MDLYAEILASTIRLSVPLVLACLAGLWSERSGIVDIGLEGKMLAAAFIAASASAVYGSAWIGLFFAILVSVGFALVHGYAAINQRGNQVVSGVAINMLAAGLAVVLGNTWFKEGGRTPSLPPSRFPVLPHLRTCPSSASSPRSSCRTRSSPISPSCWCRSPPGR